jgi:hypothetical protein
VIARIRWALWKRRNPPQGGLALMREAAGDAPVSFDVIAAELRMPVAELERDYAESEYVRGDVDFEARTVPAWLAVHRLPKTSLLRQRLLGTA